MVILNLSVLEGVETVLDSALCEGESMTFAGADLNASGTYVQSLTGANGCDSTVVLNLTIEERGTPNCLVSSVEDPLVQTIRLYPNPTRESLTVESTQLPVTDIQLFSINGQLLQQTPSTGTHTRLDMSQLTAGIYWVRVHTDAGIKQEKIVKMSN